MSSRLRNFAGKRQRGVSLLIALFILVVLSLLGAAMMNIMNAGSESVAREVISIRALHAAESGAQRQLNEIFAGAGSAACVNQSYSFPALNSCAAVTTVCSVVTIAAINYYTIASSGTCGPAAEPAVRIIEVQARDI